MDPIASFILMRCLAWLLGCPVFTHCLSCVGSWLCCFFSRIKQAELSKFVEEKLLMHKRSARNLHLNGSIKSGGTSLFGGGGSMVLPTSNNAGTIFKVRDLQQLDNSI